jgi:hypothetical protein
MVIQDRLLEMPMNRDEAVTYLKEVLMQCKDMSPEEVSFQQQTNAEGFCVHIKGAIHPADKEVVKEVAKKFSYEVKEDANSVVVYTPK